MRRSPPPIPLALERRAEKDFYVQGEPITLRITLRNATGEAVELEDFPGRVTLDMVDSPADEGVAIGPAPSQRRLAPGEEATISISIAGELSMTLSSGRYTVHVAVRLADGRGVSFGGGVIFVLLPKQGALEKAVSVEQVREVQGVRITLRRVEFLRDKTSVVAIAVWPNYRPTTELGPVGAPHGSSAKYRVDGGPWQEVHGAANRETPEGVYLEWTLGPVPSDAGTLEFVVTGFGINPSHLVTGLWQWVVYLQSQ